MSFWIITGYVYNFIAVCVIIGNGGSPIKLREAYLQTHMFITLNAIEKKRQQNI